MKCFAFDVILWKNDTSIEHWKQIKSEKTFWKVKSLFFTFLLPLNVVKNFSLTKKMRVHKILAIWGKKYSALILISFFIVLAIHPFEIDINKQKRLFWSQDVLFSFVFCFITFEIKILESKPDQPNTPCRSSNHKKINYGIRLSQNKSVFEWLAIFGDSKQVKKILI